MIVLEFRQMTGLSGLLKRKKLNTYLLIVLATISFIVSIVAVSLYADYLILDYTTASGPPVGAGGSPSITRTLGRYDGGHYVSIAAHGYVTKNDAAFMPLYPLLMRLVERISSISYVWSGLLVSWVSLVVVAILIYKLAELEFKDRKIDISPWWVIGLIAIFPSAFFLVVPYTESLFLLLTVGALLAYRKDKYLIATCLAGLSAFERDQGIVIAVYFIVDYLLTQRKSIKKLMPVVGCAVGLALYMVFLQRHYGSPIAFITAEKQWNRFGGNFFSTVFQSFRPIYLWFIAFAISGLRCVWRYLGKTYFFYSLAMTIFPLLSGSFDSFNRFMLIIVPFYLGIAIYLKKHAKPSIQLAYICSSVFLLAFSVILFANGYFIG